VDGQHKVPRGYHPLWHRIPPDLDQGVPPDGSYLYKLQFGVRAGVAHPDSKFELFPLHSQLLRESWLVSFPPLINMLKSSGSSYLS
jgi:hypothetical protein